MISKLMQTLLACLALSWSAELPAQPKPAGDAYEGMLGMALVFPSGTENIFLVARNHQLGDAILMTDDGSIRVDMPGDGEHWALIPPIPGTNTIEISGTVEGVEIWHEESVELPAAWMATTYPVTLLAIPDGAGWRFERALFGSLPPMQDPTGAGMSGKAEQMGLSAATLYLCWGLLILVLVGAALIRGSVLRVRRTLN